MIVINFKPSDINRARPDDEFICKDEYGREVYCFIGEYECDGHVYGVDIWAHDFDEAERHAGAMGNVTVIGQVYERGEWDA